MNRIAFLLLIVTMVGCNTDIPYSQPNTAVNAATPTQPVKPAKAAQVAAQSDDEGDLGISQAEQKAALKKALVPANDPLLAVMALKQTNDKLVKAEADLKAAQKYVAKMASKPSLDLLTLSNHKWSRHVWSPEPQFDEYYLFHLDGTFEYRVLDPELHNDIQAKGTWKFTDGDIELHFLTDHGQSLPKQSWTLKVARSTEDGIFLEKDFAHGYCSQTKYDYQAYLDRQRKQGRR